MEVQCSHAANSTKKSEETCPNSVHHVYAPLPLEVKTNEKKAGVKGRCIQPIANYWAVCCWEEEVMMPPQSAEGASSFCLDGCQDRNEQDLATLVWTSWEEVIWTVCYVGKRPRREGNLDFEPHDETHSQIEYVAFRGPCRGSAAFDSLIMESLSWQHQRGLLV